MVNDFLKKKQKKHSRAKTADTSLIALRTLTYTPNTYSRKVKKLFYFVKKLKSGGLIFPVLISFSLIHILYVFHCVRHLTFRYWPLGHKQNQDKTSKLRRNAQTVFGQLSTNMRECGLGEKLAKEKGQQPHGKRLNDAQHFRDSVEVELPK